MKKRENLILMSLEPRWRYFYTSAPKQFRIDFLKKNGVSLDDFIAFSKQTFLFDYFFLENNQSDLAYKNSIGYLKDVVINDKSMDLYNSLPSEFTFSELRKTRLEKGLPIRYQDRFMNSPLFSKQYDKVNGEFRLGLFCKRFVKPVIADYLNPKYFIKAIQEAIQTIQTQGLHIDDDGGASNIDFLEINMSTLTYYGIKHVSDQCGISLFRSYVGWYSSALGIGHLQGNARTKLLKTARSVLDRYGIESRISYQID